jgi:hypothetical protein
MKATKAVPIKWRAERLSERALPNRPDIRIICTSAALPLTDCLTPPRHVRLERTSNRLDRILSAEGDLQPLVAKTRELRALAGLVQGFLSADLACEVRVANLKDGELVLLAANSAAAARLRLVAPALCRLLQERQWQVNSVSARVQPNLARRSAQQASVVKRKSVHLSTGALDNLRRLHDKLAPSPARDALGRLLRRQKVLREP